MDKLEEHKFLQDFAKKIDQKILNSLSDLDQDEFALLEFKNWCERFGNIAVLNTGTIITSIPGTRVVQNCKNMLIRLGIFSGKILLADNALILLLLSNASSGEGVSFNISNDLWVSEQQARLRILVKEAIIAGVSDIHIEIRHDIARVKFRKHGELYLHAEWMAELGREIATVAFNKETDHSTTHFNPNVPQNASMLLNIDDIKARLRLASLPAHGGFDMVMRVLTSNNDTVPTIEELGYTPEQAKLIKRALKMPHGAIIIAGPTGSGKTTTLASCMQLVESSKKIYSAEDPVEKVIANATQIPINPEIESLTFASTGRAALRMDPDLIMLGETRDTDTAEVMVRAAITGHLILSTLHTNTAPLIVTRLIDLGVSAVMLADNNLLVCLVCQRLIPKLCEKCAIPINKSAFHKDHWQRFQDFFQEDFLNIKVRSYLPCTNCHGLGIIGRTVIAEVIWVDEKGRYFIQNQDILGWTEYLYKNNWTDYKHSALNLVTKGKVDPFDAEKVIGPIIKEMDLNEFKYE